MRTSIILTPNPDKDTIKQQQQQQQQPQQQQQQQQNYRGAWLALSVEHVTLDLRVVSLASCWV